MSKDIIYREDAIWWVKTECNPYGKPTLDFESGKKVIEHLEYMPSAPSIDIVRCGECKMWMSEHLCQWWSRYGTVETDADDFCSYGEREGE